MVVNKVTFAELAGVGKASVTLSVQRGKLIETADGFIDTENELNKAYLESRKNKGSKHRLAPKPKKEKPAPAPKIEKKPHTIKTSLDALDGTDLDAIGPEEIPIDYEGIDAIGKMAVDIRLKKAQAQRHELKYEQDKGELVHIEAVERTAAKLHSEIKIRIQDLPKRMAPRLLAMAASGSTEREVQTALEKEIDDAMDAVRLAGVIHA